MMARNLSVSIGTLAERTFAQMCAEADLICNKSDEDEAGWDYFVQFGFDENHVDTLEKRPPALGAFIQVKASTINDRTVKLKLSNGERMITEPWPVFFAVFHYTPQKEIRSLKLAHVNNTAICYILEKLRAIPKQDYNKIHKTELNIPLSFMETHTIKSAADLVFALKTVLNLGIDVYVANKAMTRKTAGYKENAFSGTFSLPSKTGNRALVAVMLGERKSITVRDFRLVETRFGIEKEVVFSKTARISIEITTPQRVVVVAEDAHKTMKATFECDMLVPNLPGLQFEDFRVLIRNEYISFQIDHKRGIHKWRFQTPQEEKLEWTVMRNIVAMAMMCEAGAFSIKCYLNGRKIASGQADRIQRKRQRSDYIDTFIRSIDRLCRDEGFKHFAIFSMADLNSTIKYNNNLVYMITEPHNMLAEATLKQIPTKAYNRGTMIYPLVAQASGGFLGALIIIHAKVDIKGTRIRAENISLEISDATFEKDETSLLNKLKITALDFSKGLPDDQISVIDEKIHDDTPEKAHLLAEGNKF